MRGLCQHFYKSEITSVTSKVAFAIENWLHPGIEMLCHPHGQPARTMTIHGLSLVASQRKIGEGFWPLGFADTVLIKTIFGNGDLESSQPRIGRPGATGTVSVVARYLAFLTEIFGAGVADAEKAEKGWVETKNAGRRSLVVRR